MKWLKKWRLRSLREQLAIVNAKIAALKDVENSTGSVYPMYLMLHEGNRASLLFKISEIEKSL